MNKLATVVFFIYTMIIWLPYKMTLEALARLERLLIHIYFSGSRKIGRPIRYSSNTSGGLYLGNRYQYPLMLPDGSTIIGDVYVNGDYVLAEGLTIHGNLSLYGWDGTLPQRLTVMGSLSYSPMTKKDNNENDPALPQGVVVHGRVEGFRVQSDHPNFVR